jgi:hypothetical protein
MVHWKTGRESYRVGQRTNYEGLEKRHRGNRDRGRLTKRRERARVGKGQTI